MKRLAAALLTTVAALALSAPAHAQQETASYIYEWVHLRVGLLVGGGAGRQGVLFLGDTTAATPGRASSSTINGYVTNNSGEVVLDCAVGVGGGNLNLDIVQVGPFAQEAHGDVAELLEVTDGECEHKPLGSLTLNCPFQGIPARDPRANGHSTFTHSGTVNRTPHRETFSQQGRHGPDPV